MSLEFETHLQIGIGDWELEKALRGFRSSKTGLAPEST
jgi:hypothetical protein